MTKPPRPVTQGANHPIFVKTDMVCYKRLLYMVGFLGPSATTSGWKTFPTEIQDDVQDGRHILKYPYYHRLLLYFHMQYIVSMLFSKRTTLRSLYAIGRPSVCLSVCLLSVVCLSVTLVHPTQAVELFGNFFTIR